MTKGGFARWPCLLSVHHIFCCWGVHDGRVDGAVALGEGVTVCLHVPPRQIARHPAQSLECPIIQNISSAIGSDRVGLISPVNLGSL
jgi:hypothetical protein